MTTVRAEHILYKETQASFMDHHTQDKDDYRNIDMHYIEERDPEEPCVKPETSEKTESVLAVIKDDQDVPRDERNMTYTINSNPGVFLSLTLGFQHYLLMMGSVTMPLISTAAMCIGEDNVGKSEVIGTAFFVSGLGTLLQTTLGSRLPIVQSNSPTFLPPVITLMSLPQWECPNQPPEEMYANGTSQIEMTRSVWTERMREVQGAMILASLTQVIVGLSGVVGVLLPYIGPLTIVPSVALIGLSLFGLASETASSHWGISALTVLVASVCCLYLRSLHVPCPSYSRGRGCSVATYPIFRMVPIILAIAVPWLLVIVLTSTGVLPENPEQYGFQARADLKIATLHEAKWFRFPYPGQWGFPTFSSLGLVAMLASVVAGIIESIGDYYACARLAGAPTPPVHAVNRGVLCEGVGIGLAGIFGTSCALTSYSENVGAIGITKVGSRQVIQIAGLCMVVFGMLGKFGALFVIIPEPIIGGLFFIVFGMVTAVGISNLQYVDLTSTRNLYIIGLSLMLGLGLPHYMNSNPGLIKTGSMGVDQVITVLLSTPMFVGGVIGFFLDNTVKGSDKERGLTSWRADKTSSQGFTNETLTDEENVKSAIYDLPIGMGLIRRLAFTKYMPVCPTFRPFKIKKGCSCC